MHYVLLWMLGVVAWNRYRWRLRKRNRQFHYLFRKPLGRQLHAALLSVVAYVRWLLLETFCVFFFVALIAIDVHGRRHQSTSMDVNRRQWTLGQGT